MTPDAWSGTIGEAVAFAPASTVVIESLPEDVGTEGAAGVRPSGPTEGIVAGRSGEAASRSGWVVVLAVAALLHLCNETM